MEQSKGQAWRLALAQEQPLQVVGVVNAYAALLADSAGFKALYVSGAAVANVQGLPDLGLITLADVVATVQSITARVALPVLVDADTGFGSILNVAKTVQALTAAGAAGLHLEDQTWPKRCGQLSNKQLVTTVEMQQKIAAAVKAKTCADFFIMARTDALAVEGLESAIKRAQAYVAAGAEMIFAEALGSLEEYQAFTSAIGVPVLGNLTEFGKTPLYTVQEMAEVGVAMALYPLSAFRAMNAAALQVYQSIRKEGSQKNILSMMQSREDLYKFLHYSDYEATLKAADDQVNNSL